MQANASFVQKSLTDKQRYWLDHVQRCEATDQSMVAYAKAQSLDLKQFYNWKMRLTRLRVLPSSSKSVAFKRISVRPDRDLETRCRIECPNGIRVIVEPGCDPVWLTSIIKAVGQST